MLFPPPFYPHGLYHCLGKRRRKINLALCTALKGAFLFWPFLDHNTFLALAVIFLVGAGKNTHVPYNA